MDKATIVSSGREVTVQIEGNEFWVVHPCHGVYDSFMRANGYISVSGPFALTDPRFRFGE